MKKLVLFFFILGIVSTAGAQSKKTLRTYGISKITTTTIPFNENEPQASYVSEIEMFNKNGEWIEKIRYAENGEIKKRQVRVYHKRLLTDEIIDLPQEKEWTEKTPSYDRWVYEYNKKRLLIEDREISRKGNVKQRRTYAYNKFGDAIERKTFDKNEELKYTDFYSYNKKGLKTERKRVDPNGETLEIRTYAYE